MRRSIVQRPYSHTLRGSLKIKEQLEAVEEEVEKSEVVITTLNGIPGSWDLFIQGMCARRGDFGKSAYKEKLDS